MKLFIDDERYPATDDFKIVRSSLEAIEHVQEHGIPSYISFDHDLGGDDVSTIFIKFLIEYMLDNNLKLPENFKYYVHSQNPIGKKNIEMDMELLIKHFGYVQSVT